MIKEYRKVIQISFAAYQGCGLVALCDDGTLWYSTNLHDPENPEWTQIALPPQAQAVRCNLTKEQLKTIMENKRD